MIQKMIEWAKNNKHHFQKQKEIPLTLHANPHPSPPKKLSHLGTEEECIHSKFIF